MHSHSDDAADAALLELLTAPVPPTSKQTKFSRRDAALDPLMIAAAAASGPHITRNHYHHDFFPGVMLPQHEGSWDWSKWTPGDPKPRRHLAYVSRQAPRSQRLPQEGVLPEAAKENDSSLDKPLSPTSSPTKRRRPSLTVAPDTDTKSRVKTASPAEPVKPVEVRCMARTRIPTPHGPAFLHLYHNNRDNKEHLAIVIDSAQYSESSESVVSAPPIRSHSLDAVWDENETEMDRITRGAYVGRLSPTSRRVSTPATHASPRDD
ncbi:putative GTP cyclohydrolase-2 [Mycena venus]|uniref:Putative GTP cyclohydrolase-2 n=1 Tax=Mycena venus TaxID=2733690 RepID=A0A8H7CYX1_9AGAR|nr:putative GTP cyclohydrolase-2 [Mycena venus]